MLLLGNAAQTSGSRPYTPLMRIMTLKMSASINLDAIYFCYCISISIKVYDVNKHLNKHWLLFLNVSFCNVFLNVYLLVWKAICMVVHPSIHLSVRDNLHIKRRVKLTVYIFSWLIMVKKRIDFSVHGMC